MYCTRLKKAQHQANSPASNLHDNPHHRPVIWEPPLSGSRQRSEQHRSERHWSQRSSSSSLPSRCTSGSGRPPASLASLRAAAGMKIAIVMAEMFVSSSVTGESAHADATLDPEWPDDDPPDDMVSSGRGGRKNNRKPAVCRIGLRGPLVVGPR